MKLKKCLVILPLLALTLSACNSTRVSEPLDDSETSEETSSEETSQTGEEETQTTFTNYTLSIEIRYNGDVEKVPEYATAYIQGGWDSWTSWVALTENNDRYEYSFASLDLGTYEYQLVLAYEDKEPGWTYRITQDGANASFTVDASDGDNHVNEVTVTSEKALEDIIPDPSAAINNVKVTIDITLDGVSQEVLDYGSLWIEGSWDWSEGFVKCDVEEGHYTYTFTSLAPIEYEFLGVIYYKDEQLPDDNSLWDYKVNGDANCKFTVETSSVSATLVATKALSEILPPIGGDTGDEGGTSGQNNDTYSISVVNADSLLTLEYDANATEQQVVVLDISLVTTKGDGSSTSVTASAEDVTFTDYDSSIISISGLTITPLNAGSTSLTISWGEYASTTLNVVVSDTTASGTPGEEDPNLETAQAILDVAASTQYIFWDALEATEYTDGEVTAEVLLALDENEKGYGYWYQYDEDGDPDTYNYYVEGTKYVYDPNEDEGEQYYIPEYGGNIDLDTFLDDYGEILEDAEDIDLTDQDTTYSLEATGEGHSLSVTVSSLSVYNTELTYRYTFVVDSNDTIVGLGYYGPDNAVGLSYSGFSASESTYAAVVSAMATEFDITNWTVEEEGLGESITLYFTFTYGETAQTLTEYEQIYLNGGWDGGEWNVTTTLSYDEESELYYATITYGEGEDVSSHWFNFNLILEYSDAAFEWDDDSIVLIDGNAYWTHESEVATATYTVTLTDTFENLLTDRGAAVVTYVITIKHGETALEAAPDNINLYAAGDFNGTWNSQGSYYDWGDPVLLENNQDGTYNLVLYELPVAGRTIEIIVDDTDDSSQSMWDSILVTSYTLTSTDVDTSSSKTISLELTTSYDGWYTDNGIFPPVGTVEEEFYVAFVNGSTGDFTDYTMTFTADIDCWEGGSSTASHTTVSDNHYAFYSGVGKSVSGVSTNFELSSNGHSFKTTSAVTIPTNSEGTPIYIGICWVDGWQDDTTYTTWDVDTSLGGWYYIQEGQTVEQFLNSFTVPAYYWPD